MGCEGFSIMIYCGNKENLLGAAFKKYNPSYAQLKAAPVLEGPTSFEKDAIDHDGSNNDNKNNVNNIDNDNDNNNNIENNNNNNNINNKKTKTTTKTTTTSTTTRIGDLFRLASSGMTGKRGGCGTATDHIRS